MMHIGSSNKVCPDMKVHGHTVEKVSGMDSIEINICINSLIELKKLTFHTPEENKKSKCHMMHIGSSNKVCPGMKCMDTL